MNSSQPSHPHRLVAEKLSLLSGGESDSLYHPSGFGGVPMYLECA